MSKSLVYVAHPVTGQPRDNCDRAKRWLKWLRASDQSRVYMAPWIPEVECLGYPSDQASYTRALEDDRLIASRCDAIVLCGAHVSPGMEQERDVVSTKGGHVVDLTIWGFVEPPTAPVFAESLCQLMSR